MPTLKVDQVLGEAVDLARTAAESIAEPGTVGEHAGIRMEAERLATHLFTCTATAYRGWTWAVTVARVPRSKHVTICETHLLPTADALLAPAWIPYAERLQPGDLGVGDVLPYVAEDPLLEPGFQATDDEETDGLALFDLGLGRARVLSAEGREAAAQRWYDGSHGPTAAVAEKADQMCVTCGYYLPMAGALRRLFGVCASGWSPSDGQVVSIDHGCGAHSETDLPSVRPVPVSAPIIDDLTFDEL